MAGAAEALLEVCVDGGEAVAVVERQEEEGDDEVAEEEETPETLAPIMPKATRNQGERRPARKKASLVRSRPVRWETRRRIRKYAMTTMAVMTGYMGVAGDYLTNSFFFPMM